MHAARFLLFPSALLAAGCNAGPTPAQERTVVLPADAVVLPGSAVGQLLQQCSRSAPEPGDSTWQPFGNDIGHLEAALPAALAASDLSRIEARMRADRNVGPSNPENPAWATAPRGWWRQYVGIVRGGRRFIYGNFFPRRPDPLLVDRWKREPTMVCDGGPVFFGAEWDVEARRFTHIAFNGALG